MSSSVSWKRRRSKNRVLPVDDLISERIEVRPGRFIRVLHFSPEVSTTTSRKSEDRGKTNDSRTSERSVSLESHLDNQNIIVIFFIHGVGGCAELWSEQLRHFCRAGYAVVSPDLLGHGGSSSPRDEAEYEFSELSYDMMTIFDRFSKKRNIIVGHSYGSSFCCLIASARSRKVSKVVLISGGAPIPLQPESCSLFCLPTFMLAFIKPCLLWSYERRAFHRPHRSKTKYVRAFSAPLYVLKAVLQGQKWEIGDESFHNELMVSALLIHGAQDTFVTLQEEQWMQESIYSSTLEVIQDAGHMVMLEKPEKVNWLIHNFLQRDPTTRSTVLSPSREVSKDSIHVKATTSSTRRQSLAVDSPLPEVPFENAERSQSISQLRRCSAVSLTVPTTHAFRSNSLPGSSTNINEEKEVKVEFKGVEVKISNKEAPKDETVSEREHNNPGEKETKEDPASLSNQENSSISSFSPQERRKGVSIVSNGPMPSLEAH